jgi:hypothetical protein
MEIKDMMRRIRLMCVFAVTAYAAANASAQSFAVAVESPATTAMVAGLPHPMTVTRVNGGVTETSYSGPKSLTAGIAWELPVNAAPGSMQICARNAADNCSPPIGACTPIAATPSSVDFVFGSGVAKFCLVTPEVGTFSISVNEGPVGTTSPPTSLTARPDHFDLSVDPIDLGVDPIKNRSELTCPGAGSIFTYMGEPIGITFKLKAKTYQLDPANPATSTITRNYAGDFVKFTNPITDSATWTTLGVNNMGLWMVATGYPVSGTDTCSVMFSNATPSETSFFACTDPANNPAPISRAAGPRVTISSTPAVPSMSWANGEGTFTVNVVLQRADLRDGLYESVSIGIAPVDNDGVKLLPAALVLDANNDGTNERASVVTAKLRYGRFKIPNAYGSELLPLPIEVQAQYWARNAYVSNTEDGCTPVASGSPLISSFTTAQAQGTAISTSVAGVGTLTSGKGKIALTKPSPKPAGKGAVDVSSQLSYLPGTGRATFGVYKGGPVIYLRELHY